MRPIRRVLDPVILALAVLVLGAGGGVARADRPARIVSTNLCADQLAVALIGTERLVSVSFLAADPT
ncbi:MAG: ABC transporter substrate-binding protein, partial [Alphaproteobacteria bacterium]